MRLYTHFENVLFFFSCTSVTLFLANFPLYINLRPVQKTYLNIVQEFRPSPGAAFDPAKQTVDFTYRGTQYICIIFITHIVVLNISCT